MTKAQAEAARTRAIAAVAETQAKIGRAKGEQRELFKRELQQRLTELAAAKAALREVNLRLARAKPIEAPVEPAQPQPPNIEELATRLMESFQALLIANPSHAAIRALRAHFEAEQPIPAVVTVLNGSSRLRPSERVPPIRYMDADRRRSSGPGAMLYGRAR